MSKLRNLFALICAGGLGVAGASSLLGVAHAQAAVLDPVTVVSAATGSGPEMGGFALVGVLVWLLQHSTKERVVEAKEAADNQRSLQEATIKLVLEMHAFEAGRADKFLQMIQDQFVNVSTKK